MKALPRVLPMLVLATGAFAAAPHELVTKEATGEAAIVDGNEARAEREATDRALRNAVEQVAGVLVSADTLTRNSQLISDRIFAKSAGYVRKYAVLSKRKEGGVMLVTVKADVGAAELDQDLAAVQRLVDALGRRRLVIVTHENAIDEKGIATKSEVMATVLTEAFRKDGWTIRDEKFGEKLQLAAGVALGAPQAKEIGKQSQADYILYGTVNFRYQPPDPKWGQVDPQGRTLVFHVTGEYDLAFFATDSGVQIAKVVGKFNTGDMGKKGSAIISYERTAHDIALSHGEKVIAQVRGAVVEHLRDAEVSGTKVVVSVVGLPDYAAVQDFKKSVAKLTNVKGVTPGTFREGKAEFDLTYLGTTSDLADVLGTAKFKKQKISVVGVTTNTVQVAVGK
ncbi:MAG: flagellar assembly protein T N-terminal domain-containing protein [Myxococcales bacterium]|nr:flagellar assembly protein T N-terminal domain-containing protein [Myxococcales bacterium]